MAPQNSDAGDILGCKLIDMNARAMQARYGDEVPQEGFTWRTDFLPDHDNGMPYSLKKACEAVKAMDCLLYQCHEGDVPQCLLYQAVAKRRDQLRQLIVCELPEYQSAPWDA
jgi:hypothetical protein